MSAAMTFPDVSVRAADGDGENAGMLTASCSRCGQSETLNDEDGQCTFLDLFRWAATHATCEVAR